MTLPFVSISILLLNSTVVFSANIIKNPSFETGELQPWFLDRDFCVSPCADWAVRETDAHSGIFGATNVGNIEMRQNFIAVPTSEITQVSFWMKHPDGILGSVVDFFYSDGTEAQFLLFTSAADWEFFDVTDKLAAGKSLTGVSFFGFSSTLAALTQRTSIDDVLVAVRSSEIAEPASLSVLGPAMFGLVLLSRRKRQRLSQEGEERSRPPVAAFH